MDCKTSSRERSDNSGCKEKIKTTYGKFIVITHRNTRLMMAKKPCRLNGFTGMQFKRIFIIPIHNTYYLYFMPPRMKVYCFLFIALNSFVTNAQQFGGHPPSQKWKQLNTDTLRVIFPAELEKEAAHIAAIIHRLAQTSYPSIGNRLKKISVVLQNHTTISNGYVGLGPWRSEFMLTPMQNSFDLGSIPWPASLALHEFRHVQQYSNFRKGLSGVVYTIFGEQALDLVNSAAVPNWFWEGDAVHQETIMSNQGRGRLPYFFNGYRSLWAAKKNYSWMKLRNGSLRDYLPDHYQLGYMMTAYGREKYGEDIWARVTDDAVRFRGLFYPFQRAVRKYTGKSFPQFRAEVFRYFQDHTTPAADSVSLFAGRAKHFAGDEEFGQFIDANSIIFVKSTYKSVPAFMIRDLRTASDRELRKKDISVDNYFSYRNGRIVYAARVPDLRWGWRDYSEIRLLETATGKQKNISSRSRYFSPDISEEGDRIVAVNVDLTGKSSLIILSTAGEPQKQLPNKEALFYTFPKFYGREYIVTAARNRAGEMALLKLNIDNGAVQTLIPWSANIIGYPLVSGDTISFTASRAEHDQLFMLIGEKLYSYRLDDINNNTGNYQLSVAAGKACWTSFSAVGYRLITNEDPANRMVALASNALTGPLPFFGVSVAKNINNDILRDTTRVFSSYKYHKAFRLLNIHSFRPFIDERDYRFSLIGQNVLNTLESELYFNYNTNEKSKRLGADLSYAALFPWIRIGGNYTIDRSARYRNSTVLWNEMEGRAGLLVPLNFSKGRYFRNLSFSSDMVYNKRSFRGIYKDTFDARGFAYMRAGLNYNGQVQTAKQHIYPRYAQSISISYSQAVSLLKGRQLLASASWYFPGLAPTHNLVINTAFQGRDTLREVNFSNSFPFSRGYIAENFHRMYKLGANYHFPLVYPDWGFGNIVYFLRVRANLFCDFTRVYDYAGANRVYVSEDYLSVGSEIYFDTKWWNQHSVTFGLRYSSLRDARNQGISPNQWEFIVPVNLF
jgi:hypothetical protein